MNSEQLTKHTISIIQKNIKKRRIELNLSKNQLASKMGIERTNLVYIENRASGLTVNTLSKLAISLETTIQYLLSE